jgi:ATP-dependent RNA helicase RhlE
MKFKELNLNEAILRALDKEGYIETTEIQTLAIPHIMAKKDLLGCAQTGTGKTAAFALPLIDQLLKKESKKEIKVLVLTPTRELAIQVRDNFRKYSINTNLKCSVVLGGVNQKSQEEVLKKGVDILVATPGRLLDLLNQKIVKLHALETLVLDEADVMLDMGFIHDVKKIIEKTPKERQTLLFSATIPNEISELANTLLRNHITIKVSPEKPTVEKINQSLYFVDKSNKTQLLVDVLRKEEVKSAIVFTRTKHGANKVTKDLLARGIKSEVIHGNKSQNARVSALNNFKTGISKVLVATDIAARGIDISELSHVINYELPEQPETYIHRIGRTGRAGFSGSAISFCNVDERSNLALIEKLIKQDIEEVKDHKYPMKDFTLTPKKQSGNFKKKTNSFNRNNNNFRSTRNK